MWLNNIIKKVYFDDSPLSERDYERSRTFLILQCSVGSALGALTSGAFLAGFVSYLGANDQFNGIIAALPALAGVITILSPMLFERLGRRKLLISALSLLCKLMLGLMVFIPILTHDSTLRFVMLAGIYFFAYLTGAFISPASANWVMDLAPENIRGRFFGKKDSYTLAFTTIATLTMGKLLDSFKHQNAEYTGFLIVFSLATVFALIDFVFCSSIKEPVTRKSSVSIDIKNLFRMPIQNKRYRKYLIFSALWNSAVMIGNPFLSIYMVTGLKMDYTYIMSMNLMSSIVSIIAVRIWGKLADKKSWLFTTKASLSIIAVIFSTWFFINRDTAFILIPVMFFLSGIAWSGANISTFNIMFDFAPEEGRTIYIAFNSTMAGAMGFVAALFASFLIGSLAKFRFDFLGFSIGNMQIVFGITGILIAVCVAYLQHLANAQEKAAAVSSLNLQDVPQ